MSDKDNKDRDPAEEEGSVSAMTAPEMAGPEGEPPGLAGDEPRAVEPAEPESGPGPGADSESGAEPRRGAESAPEARIDPEVEPHPEGAPQPDTELPVATAAPGTDSAPVAGSPGAAIMDETVATSPDSPAAPAKTSSGVAWLALLLALGLAAGAGWFFMEAHKREAALFDRLNYLESTTTDLASSTRDLESTTQSLASQTGALDSRTAALQTLTDTLQPGGSGGDAAGQVDLDALNQRWERQLQAAVGAAVEEFEGSSARQAQQLQRLAAQLAARNTEPVIDINRDSWLLAEVEYLLRLANQRMIMAGDTVAAQALLGSADTILRDLDDIGLLGVRRALTSDLASIRAVPKIDIEGTYLRLAALIEQIDGLVIFELPDAEATLTEALTDTWQGRLRRGYQEALDRLSSYIVVRRRDTPVEALMDPHWERLVRQNLRMLLEQAQVALLSGNQVLYRESLDRSRHWVAEFFESDEVASQAMAREVSDLMEQTIAVDLPDISGSLRELDAAMDQRLVHGGSE